MISAQVIRDILVRDEQVVMHAFDWRAPHVAERVLFAWPLQSMHALGNLRECTRRDA